jgi:hypothetical protein
VLDGHPQRQEREQADHREGGGERSVARHQ